MGAEHGMLLHYPACGSREKKEIGEFFFLNNRGVWVSLRAPRLIRIFSYKREIGELLTGSKMILYIWGITFFFKLACSYEVPVCVED